VDECKPLPAPSPRAPPLRPTASFTRGGTLLHFSPQPEPFLVTEATASVHFSAQPETLFVHKTSNHNPHKCSRQDEKLTRVDHTNMRERNRERSFRVDEEAPGFRPGLRVITHAQKRWDRVVLSIVIVSLATFCPRAPLIRAQHP